MTFDEWYATVPAHRREAVEQSDWVKTWLHVAFGVGFGAGRESSVRAVAEPPAHTAVPVWLVRHVRGATYAVQTLLPVAPFPGLGLPIDPAADPVGIESVYVSDYGAVVCDMGTVVYDGADRLPPEELVRQIDYHAAGWERLPDRGVPAYRLSPPRGPFAELHPPREPKEK